MQLDERTCLSFRRFGEIRKQYELVQLDLTVGCSTNIQPSLQSIVSSFASSLRVRRLGVVIRFLNNTKSAGMRVVDETQDWISVGRGIRKRAPFGDGISDDLCKKLNPIELQHQKRHRILSKIAEREV